MTDDTTVSNAAGAIECRAVPCGMTRMRCHADAVRCERGTLRCREVPWGRHRAPRAR